MRSFLLVAFAALVSLPLVLPAGTAATPISATVVATDTQFLPPVLVVTQGSTVTWIQGTAAVFAHTVTAEGIFDFRPGFVGEGGTIGSYTFTQPSGTVINYVCIPHAQFGMRGTIVVQ